MAENSKVRLKRQIGLSHGVAIICGLIIGSGIYITPKGVVIEAGSVGLTLSLWAVTGVAAMLGALSFAELGTTFPAFGERYLYLEKFYNEFTGFLYLVFYLLLFRPAANAIKCLTFAKYVLRLGYFECEAPIVAEKLLACCLAVLLIVGNSVNVKWAARGQTVMTTISVLTLCSIAITGFVHIGQGNTEYLENSFEGTNSRPANIVLGLYYCIGAAWGWNALNFMLEELKDPYKTLPRALVISILLVTGLYLGLNTAYLSVLGPQGVINSDTVALSVTRSVWGPTAAAIIPLVIAVTTAGSFNSGLMVGSRLCFAGARKGHLPEFLSYINIRFYTPITAVIFQGGLAIFLIVALDIFTLLKNTIFANSFFDMLVMVGMLWHRYKYPNYPRPIKMPLIIPIAFLVFCIMLVVIPLVSEPANCAVGMAIILCAAVPYYLIFIAWSTKPESYRNKTTSLYRWVQKLLYCVPQEKQI